MALVENGAEFLHVIISLAILLFAAKIFAEIFHQLRLPVVLGELLAGIIVGLFIRVGGLLIMVLIAMKSAYKKERLMLFEILIS
jgi:Kef-type K+ transport system membrane component KefB